MKECTRIRCRTEAALRRDMAPTPAHLAVIRRTVAKSAATFGRRLSLECVEDLVQEVFLNLWKSGAEDKLDSLPYVRRVAANATVDLLRWQSARKRKGRRGMGLELEKMLWRSFRTPEETLIEREEAYQLLEADPALRRRVQRTMEQVGK